MSIQVTPETLRALRVAISMAMSQGRGMASPIWQRIAMLVTATTKHVSMPQHAATARLRKWEGERKTVGGKAYDYQVTPDEFEATVGIPLTEIEDDNIGAWTHTLQDMGLQVELWPDDLVIAVLLLGESALCFDGKAFFANDHSLKSGTTIDNLFASTSLTKANVAAVVAEMKGWVGEDSRSLRVTPNLLVVPPALEDDANEICQSNIIAKVFGSNTAAAGVDNTMRGRLTPLVLPELAADAGGSDSDYYIFDTTKPTKPLAFVQRAAPKITHKHADNDDNVFWDRQLVSGVRARGCGAFGPFFLAAKCKA